MSRGVAYPEFRAMILGFPGVEEATAYGTPIFKIKKKMVARLWDDPAIIVVKINFPRRPTLIEGAPETFFTTPHHEPSPLMLVRLKTVRRSDWKYLIEGAWRMVAPKRLIEDFERTNS